MKTENRGNEGFLQRASVEHQGYAEARSTDRSEGKERDGASGLLEAILDRDNLNRAYKRVKSNHGAAGIDGMSVEEALPWLKEHREELCRVSETEATSQARCGERKSRNQMAACENWESRR